MTIEELQERCKDLCSELRVESAGEAAPNRVASLIFLMSLLRPRRVLEIGSHKGVTTEVFCLFADKVVAVDPWYSLDSNPEVFKSWDTFNHFKKRMEPYADKLEIHVGCSPETLYKLPAATFDLAYIDGNHDYEPVLKDIKECKRLVKPFGLICGHDYGAGGISAVTAAVLCGFGRDPDMLMPDTTWIACNAETITVPARINP